MQKKQTLSVREAGKLGGLETKRRQPPDFYRRIGQMGGRKVRELIERAKATGETG